MSCDLLSLATSGVAGLQPYHPGKPIEELQRELGLDNIIKLASNENPLGPSPAVLESIQKSAASELTRYPDGNGFNLKKALSEKHSIDPNRITLGNGSNEVLDMLTRTFVQPEHEVIYSQHSFAVYPIATQAVGAKHVVVPSVDWGNDLPAMLNAVTDRTRLMFIANPNNPTGTWNNKTAIRELLENVPEHVIVVMDEAYFEYACRDENYPDTSLWLDEFDNLVVTRTFSKAYGLAALRIGYGLSHPDVANLLNRVRSPFNNNGLALSAAVTALADDEYISRSVDVNESGLKQLMTAFDDMGLEFIPSKANFICVDFEQPAEGIYQSLLKAGVIVRPVANYKMPNHLRVSVGTEAENELFIQALDGIMAN